MNENSTQPEQDCLMHEFYSGASKVLKNELILNNEDQ